MWSASVAPLPASTSSSPPSPFTQTGTASSTVTPSATRATTMPPVQPITISTASYAAVASHELLLPPVPGAPGFALSQSSTCCGSAESVQAAYVGDVCIGSHAWNGWTSGYGPYMCNADGSTPTDVTCLGAASSALTSGDNLVGEWIQFCSSVAYTFDRFFMLPMGRDWRLPST